MPSRPHEVPIELRGAGPATRQVTNFLAPGAFDGADKLICCELLTPDGNWSSYPPHKHDDTEGSPVENEEIYYFRIGRVGTTGYAPEGYGFHRTYTHDGSIDATVTVRDGDVFLVPRGYHGPVRGRTRLPDVLPQRDGGPGARAHVRLRRRSAARTGFVTRGTGLEADPRVPMTSAEGPTWTR